MLRRTAALITLLFSLLSITSMASAEEYANATEARAAAVKAMKDFQSASLECKDITNAKNNLTALESAGIKLILERSKTLLDDCAVPDMFSEKSIKELNTDKDEFCAIFYKEDRLVFVSNRDDNKSPTVRTNAWDSKSFTGLYFSKIKLTKYQ